MTVVFRDRPLKEGEHSHYYCSKCEVELHPDLAYSHKCSILLVEAEKR
jgi:orotate phosphoribosyltransferase